MDKVFDKVWANCLEIIKDIVEWQHFKTWFEPIKPVAGEPLKASKRESLPKTSLPTVESGKAPGRRPG